MTPILSGHFSIFGLVFFVLKSILGIVRLWSREKFAILTRSHVRSLIYRGLFKRFWNLFDAHFILEILLSASCPLTSGV